VEPKEVDMREKELPVLWMVVGDPLKWDKAPGRYFSARYREQVKTFTSKDGHELTAIPLLWMDASKSSRENTDDHTTKLMLRSRGHVRVLSDTNGDLIYHRVSHFIETAEFVRRVADMVGGTIERWWDEEIERKTKEIRESWSDSELAKRSAPCDQRKPAETKQITDYLANFQSFDENSI